ncbi:MAG: hypothetical protein AMK73_06115 [Planctomycetes bacterium SM23_32]|nr:MAG: hypothetical protein AMK73_06115 [Planctomycetes bacterium SM23_32]
MTIERAGRPNWPRRVKVVAILAAVVLVLIVLFQNLDKTRLVLLFWEAQVPLVALMLIALGAGAVAGALLGLKLRRR